MTPRVAARPPRDAALAGGGDEGEVAGPRNHQEDDHGDDEGSVVGDAEEHGGGSLAARTSRLDGPWPRIAPVTPHRGIRSPPSTGALRSSGRWRRWCCRRTAHAARATCRACASGRSCCAASRCSRSSTAMPTRDVTRNLALDAGRAARPSPCSTPNAEPSFAHATLHAGDADLQLRFSRKGKQAHASRSARVPPATAERGVALPAHDRAKPRALPLELPFWVDLGIADERASPGAGDGAQVEADRQVPRGPRARARRRRRRRRGRRAAGGRFRQRQGLPHLRRPRVPAPSLRRRARGHRRRAAPRPGRACATPPPQRAQLRRACASSRATCAASRPGRGRRDDRPARLRHRDRPRARPRPARRRPRS